MTAQINDRFRYGDREFAVAGMSTGELFDPETLDLHPVGTCSACWRGYYVVYSLLDRHLVVADLHVELLDKENGYAPLKGPSINGVSPTPGREAAHDWFNNHYTDLNYHLEFSGGLLLADGFIQELYVHMGFHAPWKYETVIELLFENGVLVGEFNRSERMAEVRERIIELRAEQPPGGEPTRAEIRRFIDRAFDRTYEL